MLRSVLFALLAGSLATGSSPSSGSLVHVAAADTLGRFPEVEGTSLEGKQFSLPAAFEGELNVVMVAFKREQQADVDSWTPFLRTLADRHGALRVYELPTLGRRYRLMRPVIDGGMRRGIPDAAVRAATITLYIDKSPFREALRLPDEDRIFVLLVDRQGQVLWRGAGRWDEPSGAALAGRIERARSAQSPGGGM